MIWMLLFLQLTTGLAQSPPLEAIVRSTQEEVERAWTDRGGLADDDFICWEPKIPGGTNFKIIGQRGQRNHDNIQEPIMAFRDVTGDNSALAEGIGWEFIWDDKRSINWNDGSLWRLQCPTGFVAVGDFFYDRNDIAAPGQDLKHKSRCVRANLTSPCKLEQTGKIWDDSGSLAAKDVSVWQPTVSDDQVGGFLRGNNKHEDPPAIESRCLLKSAYKLVQA